MATLTDLITTQISRYISQPKVLSWSPVKKNLLQGKFVASGRVFNFSIDAKGVSYQPAMNADSDLFSALYLEAFAPHLDAVVRKKSRCNAGKSYECGAICLGVRRRCRKGLKDLNDSRRIASIVSGSNKFLLEKAQGVASGRAIGNASKLVGARERMAKTKVISSKSSTGAVTKTGDFIEKNLILPNGKKTLEGDVYQALKGVEGVANGEVVGDKIRVPFYKNIISIDDIPKEKRYLVSHIVSKNMDRINGAVSALTNAGYTYGDPLQFGLNRDGQMDLLDFSNSQKPTDPRRVRDLESDNYNLLSNFYKQFGLDKQASIISKGIALKDLAKDYDQKDPEPNKDFIGDQYDLLTELQKSGVKANNLYYTSNARSVQLKNIGQTESRDGIKYVVSESPLSKKEQESFELRPISEQNKNTAALDKFEQAVLMFFAFSFLWVCLTLY